MSNSQFLSMDPVSDSPSQLPLLLYKRMVSLLFFGLACGSHTLPALNYSSLLFLYKPFFLIKQLAILLFYVNTCI